MTFLSSWHQETTATLWLRPLTAGWINQNRWDSTAGPKSQCLKTQNFLSHVTGLQWINTWIFPSVLPLIFPLNDPGWWRLHHLTLMTFKHIFTVVQAGKRERFTHTSNKCFLRSDTCYQLSHLNGQLPCVTSKHNLSQGLKGKRSKYQWVMGISGKGVLLNF